MRPTRLIVQADDFGICHTINQGIAESFQSGILAQTSMMVTCSAKSGQNPPQSEATPRSPIMHITEFMGAARMVRSGSVI